MSDAQESVDISAVIARALNDVLDQRDRIDREKHKSDHEWISMQRSREDEWRKIKERFSSGAVGAIALAAVTGVGYFVVFIGSIVLEYIRRG